MKLFLVRHGQDQDNARIVINGRNDTSLTEHGRMQAASVADALQSEGIVSVYASPLKRARETAFIIAKSLGNLDVRVDADLIERDYGALTGRPVSDIPEYATRLQLSHGFRYVIESPGIEPYPDLWSRAGTVLGRIRQRHAGNVVLIVAHNEIIKMMWANAEGRSWEEELRRPPMSNGQVVCIDGLQETA